MGHIFISYDHYDNEYVTQLASALEQKGIAIWTDKKISYGKLWVQSIISAIKECSGMVVVMTPEAEQSQWVEREILLAIKYNKPIFPLLLSGNVFDLLVTHQNTTVSNNELPAEDFFNSLISFVKKSGNLEKGVSYIVKGIFDMVDFTPTSGRTSRVTLRKNILIYGWLLQRKGVNIKIRKLSKLVGGNNLHVDFVIQEFQDQDLLQDKNTKEFTFSPQTMNAIEAELEARYKILDRIPFFPSNINGVDLIEYINIFSRSKNAKTNICINALQSALAVSITHVIREPLIDLEAHIFSHPKDKWSIAVVVIRNNGILNNLETTKLGIRLKLLRIRLQEQEIQAPYLLVISPGFSTGKLDTPDSFDTFSITILETIRLFMGLKRLIDIYGPRVSENFTYLFEGNQAFTLRNSLSHLEKVLAHSKN